MPSKPKGNKLRAVPAPAANRVDRAIAARGRGLAGDANAGDVSYGTLEVPHTRQDGVATRSTSLHLPVALGKRLGQICLDRGMRKNGAMVEAIEAWVEKHE